MKQPDPVYLRFSSHSYENNLGRLSDVNSVREFALPILPPAIDSRINAQTVLAARNAEFTGISDSQYYGIASYDGYPIFHIIVGEDGEITYSGMGQLKVYTKVGYRPVRVYENGTIIIGHEWQTRTSDLITMTTDSTSTIDGQNSASTRVAIANNAITIGSDVLPVNSAAISSIKSDQRSKLSRAIAQTRVDTSATGTSTSLDKASKSTAVGSTNPKGTASVPIETQTQSKSPSGTGSPTTNSEAKNSLGAALSMPSLIAYIALVISCTFNSI